MELDAVKELPRTDILTEWWSEVKENFWEQDARPQLQRLLKELMQRTLIEEIEQLRRQDVGSDVPIIARNGYYRRSLITHVGTIADLQVPRLRRGRFQTKVFRRYRRCEQLVEDLIRDIFLAGISTRRVGAAVCALLDTRISSSTVSRITRSLDQHVRAFHARPLLDEYQYLILDGIRLKIRYNGRYCTRTVLVAYGITLFGQRVLLAFRQAKGESQTAWEVLLNSLYQRGLLGAHLKLLVMDGAAGLRAAAELVYPHAKIQRCWVHKLRNVANVCPKKYHACVRKARTIYLAPHRAAALEAFHTWKRTWQARCPNAVACLERDLEELLSFYDCPVAHRIKVRTTNAIERSFREVRRRTNVFSCFSNTASTERIIYAILTHLNHGWKDAPLSGFTQF
jgi:transposase-like protein